MPIQNTSVRQPSWHRIKSLRHASRYTRVNDTPETRIRSGNSCFDIMLLRPGDMSSILAVQKLLETTFGPEEVEPVTVLIAAIEGKLPDGSADIALYRVYIAKDDLNNIVSVYAGGLIGLEGPYKSR